MTEDECRKDMELARYFLGYKGDHTLGKTREQAPPAPQHGDAWEEPPPSDVWAPSANGQAHPLPSFGPPIPTSKLRAVAEHLKWLWKGYVSRGGITLFSSLWKTGKTTLLAHLLKALGEGGFFCGTEVCSARVLYVTEEHEGLWAERRDAVGFGDWTDFLVRPFRTKPDMSHWLTFLSYLQGVCQERQYELIVFDTISNLWPVKDENDAARVQEALMPLRAVSDMASFLLNHHMRKGDGQEATAARGSGALPAFVDTLIELRRFEAGNRKDTRRVLTGYGRYSETPAEVVLEYGEQGYRCLGERQDVRNAGLHGALLPQVPTAAPGYTAKQVHVAWQGEKTPSLNDIRDALRTGTEAGFWTEEGEGHKGDPYRYWRSP